MAKASRVRGIRPKRSLAENSPKLVDARLEDMLSFRGSLQNVSDVAGLHNMRIATKRLRYALEILELCYEDAKPLVKELTKIQDDLGDIHDLDVLSDLLHSRLAALEPSVEEQAVEIAASSAGRAEQSNRLRKLLYERARDPHRLGLLGLIGDKAVERRKRYESFRDRWDGAPLDAFEARVRAVVAPTPSEQGPTTSDQRLTTHDSQLTTRPEGTTP